MLMEKVEQFPETERNHVGLTDGLQHCDRGVMAVNMACNRINYIKVDMAKTNRNNFAGYAHIKIS